MALNYTDLFENIGEFVQRENDYVGLYTDLDTDFSEIASELQANGRSDVLSGTFTIFEGMKQNVLTWINNLKSKVTELLTNKTSVLDELPGLGGKTNLDDVLIELYRAMVDANQSVDASTVTIGTVAGDKQNANAGSVITTKVLDGYNAPHTGFMVNPGYNGLDSELAGVSDTISITCIFDSESGNATEGQETFTFGGKSPAPDPFHWATYGSGVGSQVRTIQGAGLMSNMEFQTFVTNEPSDWDIDAGSGGTHILESATAHRGTKSLRLVGDADIASIQISQALPSNVNVLRRYAVGFWIQGDAGFTAGTLTIQFEGTGYTAASTEKIELDDTELAALTTFTWHSFWINLPADIPDDLKLVIKLTGTPSAHSVYINGGGMGPATYFNGIAFVVYAGSEKFIKGDRFTFDVTNNEAGTFQAAFRKMYGFQLPSNSAGTETINDSLAT